MQRSNFRRLEITEPKSGLAVWLDGQSFEDTNPTEPGFQRGNAPVCGPFLIGRVLFQSHPEPSVDLIDPETGRERSMTCSGLLVPKEK